MLRHPRHLEGPATALALVATLTTAGAGAAPASAAAPATGGQGAERVAHLCDAWATVELLHPGLASSSLDWDAAFAEAAEATWRAGGGEEYRRAVEGMLATLDDPATEVVSGDGPETHFDPGSPPPLFRWPAEGVLLVDMAGFERVAGPYPLLPAMREGFSTQLAEADSVVFDLRMPPEMNPSQDWSWFVVEDAAASLVAREATGPVARWLVHWGLRPSVGTSSGGYRSAFATSMEKVYEPAEAEAAARPIVFLVNERSRLPELALALQAAGAARIVSVGPLSDRRSVKRHAVDLGEGLTAEIRVTKLVPPGGLLHADAEVAPKTGAADPALDAALGLLAGPWPEAVGPAKATPAPASTRRPVQGYPEMTGPDLGYRLLAGCRAWGTIHFFYPYLHLIGDWDGAFRASLPELAEADDGTAYARAILRLLAHVEDGHTTVYGHPAFAALRGQARPPISIRQVEGRIVVSDVADAAVQDLSAGDEILAVDGTPIEGRIRELWPLVTGSRELTRRLNAASWSLAGAEGSTAVLTVRGADGVAREVEVPRGKPREPKPPSEEPPWRVLDDTAPLSIGYVDLTELVVSQVEPMMADLADTDAIVFDMRGYPHQTAWPLAPRLNVTGATEWARFRRREVSYESLELDEAGYSFVQRLPTAAVEPYRGKVVMLIDERAISQAEHTALMFEQTTDVTFVGTPTAGANGDVTNFRLPGGITVLFTGHDVRHADGRQLQRVGILPDVEAAPTLAGIRAGRDEVLERAVRFLLEGGSAGR